MLGAQSGHGRDEINRRGRLHVLQDASDANSHRGEYAHGRPIDERGAACAELSVGVYFAVIGMAGKDLDELHISIDMINAIPGVPPTSSRF